MSDEEPAIGAVLRGAREAQGLSIQEVASHLRMMTRQITAMEEDDFTSLGQPVFARGFVRNYARLLRLDSEALLLSMHEETAAPVEIAQELSVAMPGAWFSSGWLIAGLLVLLLFTVVPIGLYAWLSSEVEEVALPPAPPLPRPPPVGAPTAAAEIIKKTSEVPVSEVNSTPDATGVIPTSETSTVVSPVQPATKSEMHFEFDDNAWVEITDGTGQILQRNVNKKGWTLALSGQPPFTLVIGNAARVRMTYNGRPLDLKPYIDDSVARLSLEE